MAAEPIEPVAIAVLAKAPIAGFAKTRLTPVLGAEGAALLQERLIERAVATACAAATGPVTIWAGPDEGHTAFAALRARFSVALARQSDGDLGARMLAATVKASGAGLVIGTDCPVLTADHLRSAAGVLRRGADAVVFPAEDGGYVLIGTRRPLPLLFSDMRWGTAEVMTETRHRLTMHGLGWQEPYTLWDVDVPADLARMRSIGLHDIIPPAT
ncbi:MAG: TIGR04282 family arsenosugar biosynthesis glycosyltransferase [Xanthobacteraceae bacterium]